MERDMHQLEELLREIGLTNYETRVYLALLDLGKSTTNQILKKAELNTGKIYDILDSLSNKGFVSIVTENGVKNFSPADPQRIYQYIEKKKETVNLYEKSLDEFIPKILEKINNKKENIKIEIFTGNEGYKTASLKEIRRYKEGAKLYVLGVLTEKKYPKIVHSFYMENVQPKRVLKNVKVRKIFSEEARKEKQYIEKGSQIKYIQYSSPITMNIIGDLTILEIFSSEIIMIAIESKEIAQSFIDQFELIWKLAKK